MTLSWGIVATGRIARTMGTILTAHPEMAVAAVASRSLDKAQALAQDLAAPAAYDSLEALVTDPAVQAVYVGSPHPQHVEAVEIALLAGKGVLCEKPMTHSLAQTQRLVELSSSTGGFLMEAMWMRFNPLVQLLVSRLPELGDLRSVHASFGFPAPDDASSRMWAADLGGGALLDLAVYTVDLARLLLGEPISVGAKGSVRPDGVDEEQTIDLGFASGARALLDTSLLARLPGNGLLVGTRGTAQLLPTFHAPTRLELTITGRDPEVHEIPNRQAGYVGEVEEVARCLAVGLSESPVNPLSSTLATAGVLDQVRRLLGQPEGV